jgi:hypothetical protein
MAIKENVEPIVADGGARCPSQMFERQQVMADRYIKSGRFRRHKSQDRYRKMLDLTKTN